MPDAALDALLDLAAEAARNAYVPYTRRPEGAVLLLSDGSWAPGVRIENAAFPLLIAPLTAAAALARLQGRTDVAAAAQTRPISEAECDVLASDFGIVWEHIAPHALVASGARPLPSPSRRLDPLLAAPDLDDEAAAALAAQVARRAYVPESGFPVGCVIETADGRWVPGCNVEHTDWTRGLCAERVALALARAYGATDFRRIAVSCPLDPSGTPCGACRQVLAELAPGIPVVLDRGAYPPEVTTADQLLPGAFRGDRLRA